MQIRKYTDGKGFSWLVLSGDGPEQLDSGIYLGPDWSEYIENTELCKKVQNTLVKHEVYDMNTFLAQVNVITREIGDRSVMRLIRHVFAKELT